MLSESRSIRRAAGVLGPLDTPIATSSTVAATCNLDPTRSSLSLSLAPCHDLQASIPVVGGDVPAALPAHLGPSPLPGCGRFADRQRRRHKNSVLDGSLCPLPRFQPLHPPASGFRPCRPPARSARRPRCPRPDSRHAVRLQAPAAIPRTPRLNDVSSSTWITCTTSSVRIDCQLQLVDRGDGTGRSWSCPSPRAPSSACSASTTVTISAWTRLLGAGSISPIAPIPSPAMDVDSLHRIRVPCAPAYSPSALRRTRHPSRSSRSNDPEPSQVTVPLTMRALPIATPWLAVAELCSRPRRRAGRWPSPVQSAPARTHSRTRLRALPPRSIFVRPTLI